MKRPAALMGLLALALTGYLLTVIITGDMLQQRTARELALLGHEKDPIITVKTLVTETATVDDIATTAVADRDDHKKDHYSELSQSEPHIDRCAEISNPQVPSGSVVSLAAKIKGINQLQAELESRLRPPFWNNSNASTDSSALLLQIGIATTSAASAEAVIRDVVPWIQYHSYIGISRFYIYHESIDVEAKKILRQIRNVFLIDVSFEGRLEANEGNWRQLDTDQFSKMKWVAELNWTRYDDQGHPWERVGGALPGKHKSSLYTYSKFDQHSTFTGKPGNYRLMVKQSFNLQEACVKARTQGIHWLFHIDTDEIFLPLPVGSFGGILDPPEEVEAMYFSAGAVFDPMPQTTQQVHFMNQEARPELLNVSQRFEQVTLFSLNKHFLDLFGQAESESASEQQYNPSLHSGHFSLYTNGKSAGRVNEKLEQHGPHFFKLYGKLPNGTKTTHTHSHATVLHYPYSLLTEVVEKSNRSCELWDGDEKSMAYRSCFIYELDRLAFVHAMKGDSDAIRQFFEERILVRDKNLNGGDGYINSKAMSKHGFLRLRQPAMVVREMNRRACLTQ